MVTIAIIFNIIISIGCFWITWQIWQVRQTLANATKWLIRAEAATHRVMRNAPTAIAQGQQGARYLRRYYQTLPPKLQTLSQVLYALQWLSRLSLRSPDLRGTDRRPSKASTSRIL